jgi:preprotein translocase subunit SecA
MDNLRQGIGLHAFGQRDPLVMFKREGHDLFQGLLNRIQNDITHTIFKVATTTNSLRNNPKSRQASETIMSNVVSTNSSSTAKTKFSHKVGRNEPCPCGSGKKYKKCHGLAA